MPSTNSGSRVALVQQLQKRELGVEIAGDRLRRDLLAAFEHHAYARPFVTRIFATGAWCGSRRRGARRIGDGVRDRAHAAAHESPQSAMSVHAAHAVVQQNVRRAGRARPAVGADHAVGGERHLDLLGLEPLVQEVGGALREDLHQADDLLWR